MTLGARSLASVGSLLAFSLLAGCGSSGDPPPALSADSGEPTPCPEAGTADAAASDAGAHDATLDDAGDASPAPDSGPETGASDGGDAGDGGAASDSGDGGGAMDGGDGGGAVDGGDGGGSADGGDAGDAGPGVTGHRLSAGAAFTCAIGAGGKLSCFGANGGGGLGDGTTNDRAKPAAVATDTDWATVSAGGGFTCALKTDGHRWCWGTNAQGQLGNGGTASWLTPERADDTTWRAVSAGGTGACGIRADGALLCWGGQGLIPAPPPATPTQVGTDLDWSVISAGHFRACGIRSGALYCWDYAPTAATNGPAAVGSDTDWRDVSVGQGHSCAIKSDGSLWCWGGNLFGELGVGDEGYRTAPVRVNGDTDWSIVSAGAVHTCATKKSGSLWCWGLGHRGQLGGATHSDVPVRASVDDDWVDVASGTAFTDGADDDHTCAVRRDGSLYCWGDGSEGALGDNGGAAYEMHLTPTTAQPANALGWTKLGGTGGSTYAIDGNGNWWTWGEVSSLAYDTPSRSGGFPIDSVAPVQQRALVKGFSGSCALETTGGILCLQFQGPSGASYPLTDCPTSLTTVSRGPWVTFAGGDPICATDAAGAAWCWGSNAYGGLGDGTTTDSPSPKMLAGGGTWTHLTAGGRIGFCGVKGDGSLWCWGNKGYGVGSVPTRVGTDSDWADVVASDESACARKTTGAIACWGANDFGQLGDGTKVAAAAPKLVGTDTDWTQVTTSGTHTCALKKNGDAWCWGCASYGQVGDGSQVMSRPFPVKVAGTGFTALDAHGSVTCGIKTDGTIACWGADDQGQAGAPTPWSFTPRAVTLP